MIRIKMFGFIKKVFFIGLTILSTLIDVNSLSATPLSRISMTNQEFKARLLMLIVMSQYFILLVLKQVNAVVAVTILMIHIQKCVFLML